MGGQPRTAQRRYRAIVPHPGACMPAGVRSVRVPASGYSGVHAPLLGLCEAQIAQGRAHVQDTVCCCRHRSGCQDETPTPGCRFCVAMRSLPAESSAGGLHSICLDALPRLWNVTMRLRNLTFPDRQRASDYPWWHCPLTRLTCQTAICSGLGWHALGWHACCHAVSGMGVRGLTA